MTALYWLGARAFAGEADAALAARLLGPEPGSVAAQAAADPLAGLRMGLFVFGALAVVTSLWWIRKLLLAPRTGAAALPPLRVVARAPLGGAAAVAIVEVRDGREVSRYLVGYGGGPPVLLSGLFGEEAAPVAQPEPVEQPEAPHVPIAAPAPRRAFQPVEVRDPIPEEEPATPMNPLAARFARAQAAAETPQGLAVRKQATRQLIDEVLATRRREGMTA